MPLPARKQAFVDNYLLDLNAAAAAIRAGYSPRGAAQAPYRLMQETAVSDAIAVAQAARSRRTGMSADRVVRELARIAFADVRQTVAWCAAGLVLRESAHLDDDTAAAVSEETESIQVLLVNRDITARTDLPFSACCGSLRPRSSSFSQSRVMASSIRATKPRPAFQAERRRPLFIFRVALFFGGLTWIRKLMARAQDIVWVR